MVIVAMTQDNPVDSAEVDTEKISVAGGGDTLPGIK